jgi:thioredoxin 2
LRSAQRAAHGGHERRVAGARRIAMQLACPHCGTRNRVDDRRATEAVCGTCHAALAPAAPVEVPGENLTRYVTGTEQPVVVDFWADWCGPCKMMAPAFAEAARQRPGVRFVKVDTDAAPDVAARHAIRGIPTVMLFRGGKEAARRSGALSTAQLLGWIDQELVR